MSTGAITGTRRNPPSEITSTLAWTLAEMQMRFPQHVWAILTSGREAESPVYPLTSAGGHAGLGRRERWREYGGGKFGTLWYSKGKLSSCPERWTEALLARMVWTKSDGRWHGEWWWEPYCCTAHWDGTWDFDEIPSWYNRRTEQTNNHLLQSWIASSAGGVVPQELLLRMVGNLDWADSDSWHGVSVVDSTALSPKLIIPYRAGVHSPSWV